MLTPKDLFDNNARWSAKIRERDPRFFEDLLAAAGARVSLDRLLGQPRARQRDRRPRARRTLRAPQRRQRRRAHGSQLPVGHPVRRGRARVRHVIVIGHYGCGGVRAVRDRLKLGLIDNWLRHVDDVRQQHETRARRRSTPTRALDRLCELNVIEQARHVCETTIVQDAWARGQQVTVHAWIYGLDNGLLRDLGFSAERPDDVLDTYLKAVRSVLTPR